MSDDYHKYLCWLARIRGLGRKSLFRLLQTVSRGNLFMSLADDYGNPRESAAGSVEADPAVRWSGLSGLSEVSDTDERGPAASELCTAALELYTVSEETLRFLCREAFPASKRAGSVLKLLLAARSGEPERVEEELLRSGTAFTCILEKDFPERLRHIPDPPFGLYYRGGLPGESGPAAAVIGARLASGYGREQARRFAGRIAADGITVISGMARGIDGIAQRAALDAGGRSYAVLGCGTDICYPEENRNLYDRLLREGGILSEYPPGTLPEARLFPPRNRIISGLSDLVLVIEARRRSGTLITVDMALEQGREVYALPGRVSDRLSDGCNRLIRQGAVPATCPEDILEFFYEAADQRSEKEYKAARNHLNKTVPGDNGDHRDEKESEDDGEQGSGKMPPCIHRNALERAVLKVLSSEDDMHMDRILEAVSGAAGGREEEGKAVSVSMLLTALTRLQIDRAVEESAPGYYRRSGSV